MAKKQSVGRPPRGEEPSTKAFLIRLTPAEMYRIKKLAGDVPVSRWTRKILLAAIDEQFGAEQDATPKKTRGRSTD